MKWPREFSNRHSMWAVVMVLLITLLTMRLDQRMTWLTLRTLVRQSTQPGLQLAAASSKQVQQISLAGQFWWGGWQRLAAAEARWRTVQLDTATLVTLEKENQLLRTALQWQQAHGETVYAWKGSGTTWWMAAGCEEGVQAGEAVVHDHTIIGTVQRVGQQESAVATVADPDWRLAVVIGTASAQGVFMTQRGTPSVEEIAPQMPVAVGEIITTAGQAGVPRGLIVGKVMAIQAENSQATKTVTVDLSLLPSAANWVQLTGGETRRSTCP
jgi:hypothetical protein